jgi:sec-independent protein translocase protein TatA
MTNGIMLAFLGWPEIVAILAIVLLLFGAKKLPELARGLGKGIQEFKKATQDVQSELERAIEEPPPPPRPVPPPTPTSTSGPASPTSQPTQPHNPPTA